MSVSAKLRRAPLRIATGAYFLNSGVTKFGADDDAAKSLHGMASGAYPFLDKMQPKTFARTLALGELTVGAALLVPIVPPMIAGAALVGFSGALLNLYWKTPGMHEEGSPRPTAQGAAFAKDAWLLGIGAGLMADAAFEPAHDRLVEFEATTAQRRADRSRRSRRKAKRTRHQLAELRAEYAAAAADRARAAAEAAMHVAQEYGPVAADKARSAREAAMGVAHEYGPVAAEKARSVREAALEAAHDYRPVAAKRAKSARHAAQEAGAKIRERLAS